MRRTEASGENRSSGLQWLVGVFVSSAAVMSFELALTRLFSATLNYHFVFVAVSLTIFGLAVGGLVIHRVPQARSLGSALLSMSGAGIILVLLTLTLLPLGRMWPAYLLFTLPPFIALGAFQAMAFTSHSHPGRLYAADLTGAALSAGATLLALRRVDLPVLLLIIAGILILGGIVPGIFMRGTCRRNRLALSAAALAFFSVVFVTGLWQIPPGAGSAGKPIHETLARKNARVIWSRWNESSRVDVVDLGIPEARFIYTDGSSVSQMFRFDGNLKTVAALKKDSGFFPLANGAHGKVAIIGSGGGKDVLISMLAGSKSITALEIDRGVVEAMERFRSYNGGLYEKPGVRAVTGDGRHYMEGTRERFDAIYLPLVMTQSADSFGMGLAENYAFTREAFRTYLERLSPNGQLILKLHGPIDLVKSVLTAVQVMSGGSSEAEAGRHLYILNGQGHGDVMYPVLVIRKQPLGRDESSALLEKARQEGFTPLFFPHVLDGFLPGLISGRMTADRVIRDYPFNVEPVSDDRPFFYNYERGIPKTLGLLLPVALMVAVAFVPWGSGSERRPIRKPAVQWPYFAGLGVGFMLIEVAVIQKSALLLSAPTLTAAVVVAALLVGGALGSLFVSRGPIETCARRLPVYLAFPAFAALVYTIAFGAVKPLLGLTSGLTVPLLALLFIPLGFAMGMPFPAGLRLIKATAPESVPQIWAVNGAFSVVGSVAAMTLAVLIGSTAVALFGVGLYAALFVAARMSEPARLLSFVSKERFRLKEGREVFGYPAQGRRSSASQPHRGPGARFGPNG